MGKLYDRTDKAFDLDMLLDMEHRLSRYVVAGTLGAFEVQKLQQEIDAERQACNMRLLRTGQLIADMNYAKRTVKRCPHCHEDQKGKMRCCVAHRALWHRAIMSIKWAAEENLARRASLGQMRSEDPEHEGSCNKWEQLYFEDKRNKVWPGQSRDELAYNKEQFGSLDYRGWLHMMRHSAEEISEQDFRTELERLKAPLLVAEHAPAAPDSSRKRDKVLR
jgi:hypothetical protein